MASGIIALLTALPEILKFLESIGPELVQLGKDLWKWINHVSGNDPQGYIKKLGQAFSVLVEAKTVEEKQKAAKAIADRIQGL